MAIYRTVQMGFWTDAKTSEYTVNEKFLYLYFLTNPHTNLCGCYEISARQISFETGLTPDATDKTIAMLEERGVISYNRETAEILVINWHKYNWTTSEKFRKPLKAEIEAVKYEPFRDFLQDALCDMAQDISEYGIDRVSEKADRVSEKPAKPKKESYGEQGNVKLTIDEYNKLCNDYGHETANKAINYFGLYIMEKNYKSKSHYLAIRRWVIDAVTKNSRPQQKAKVNNIDDFFARQIGG